MKKVLRPLALFIHLVISTPLAAQTVVGDWYGILRVQGMSMKLVFHIAETESGYSATFDSPNEGVAGIPFSSVSLEDDHLVLSAVNIGATYDATFEHESLKGTWKQGANRLELNMSRTEQKITLPNRPQEPVFPYPYHSEEVRFPNDEAGIELAGTLTLPKQGEKFPAVILISGSGPQDRDETFMTHKPFLVLADVLTKQGIAVLRYDDRGFGESTGNHASATSIDFATDAAAAVAFLQAHEKIDHEHIGLIGHSEGGLIAPIVAAGNDDIAFIVLLAGPGVPGLDIQKQQIQSLAPAMGLSPEQLEEEQNNIDQIAAIVREHNLGEEVAEKLTSFFLSKMPEGNTFQGMPKDQFIRLQLAELNRPWYKYFIDHNPAEYLQNVDIPILAINGSRDVQVAPENLEYIREATLHNHQVTITEYEGMNHLFQTCSSCLMSEYSTIETTISEVVLEDLSSWILETSK